MDYYRELDMEQAYDGSVQEGIRPLNRLKRYNSFEIKSTGDTLNENKFRVYSARGLFKAHLKGGQAAKGNATLNNLLSNKPLKLLAVPDHGLTELRPWMYHSKWIGDLDLFILVLPGSARP